MYKGKLIYTVSSNRKMNLKLTFFFMREKEIKSSAEKVKALNILVP